MLTESRLEMKYPFFIKECNTSSPSVFQKEGMNIEIFLINLSILSLYLHHYTITTPKKPF
jgi:hypothetical protein